MNRRKLLRRFAKPARDFLFGLVLFVSVLLSGTPDPSHPGGLLSSTAHAGWMMEEPVPVTTPDGADAFADETQVWAYAADDARHRALALASLALAFATLVAVNMWFTRHLVRVHVRRRRR